MRGNGGDGIGSFEWDSGGMGECCGECGYAHLFICSSESERASASVGDTRGAPILFDDRHLGECDLVVLDCKARGSEGKPDVDLGRGGGAGVGDGGNPFEHKTVVGNLGALGKHDQAGSVGFRVRSFGRRRWLGVVGAPGRLRVRTLGIWKGKRCA